MSMDWGNKLLAMGISIATRQREADAFSFSLELLNLELGEHFVSSGEKLPKPQR
uniref:Uncharacterized protein n=1 Tax=Rhizophora mucronata TaxID=61149 RepID=A0A2P2NLF9_RHIMU